MFIFFNKKKQQKLMMIEKWKRKKSVIFPKKIYYSCFFLLVRNDELLPKHAFTMFWLLFSVGYFMIRKVVFIFHLNKTRKKIEKEPRHQIGTIVHFNHVVVVVA